MYTHTYRQAQKYTFVCVQLHTRIITYIEHHSAQRKRERKKEEKKQKTKDTHEHTSTTTPFPPHTQQLKIYTNSLNGLENI